MKFRSKVEKKIICVLAFIFLSITSLSSVVDQYKEEISNLENQLQRDIDKDSSTSGMVEASMKYYDELDKLLNKYYKELMNTLDDGEKQALKESQREWLKFRDKEINFSSELYSKKEGTIWRVYTPGKMIDLMENRIEQLVRYLSDQKEEF